MGRRTLVYAEMTGAGNMNGVTRCIQMLADIFSSSSSFNVIWLRFTYNCMNNPKVNAYSGYSIITVPLPQDISSFLKQETLRRIYWNEAYNSLSAYLNGASIFHIHTLNLMEFALLVKARTKCKIVTHLHCLPWKGLYNSDFKLFNKLYTQYYIRKDYHNAAYYVRHEYERQAYMMSDMVVCVTDCAKDFIHNVCPNHSSIKVVPNGIKDTALPKRYGMTSHGVKCLYVGTSQPSKGLHFILSVMQTLLIQHEASLTVVGAIPQKMREKIRSQYPFLEINFTGQIGYDQLKQIYADSDIGLIASVQEQCSYAAIEMMMAGLPVITTDADGLSELFSNGYNGVKIPISFHPLYGIQVDVIRMSEAVSWLIQNPHIRKRMGINARKSAHRRFSIRKMEKCMKEIYTDIAS